MAGRGDDEDLVAALAQLGGDELGHVAPVGRVHLVEHDDRRALRQRHRLGVGLVAGELGEDDVEVADRVAVGLERRGVQDVGEDRAALDVAEELQAEPAALARTLDEAGHVGDREAGVAGLDDAQVGREGGEGVVGDLGPGGGHGRDQAGLAGARVADQGHVGDGLELEHDGAGLAGLAQQGEAGRDPPGAGQGGVAEPAAAAGGDDEPGAVAEHVGEDLALGGGHDGAVGHAQLDVVAVGAVLVPALADAALLRGAVRGAVVLQQRRDLGVDDEDDVAAGTAVAAVRAAQRLELLAVHGGHAVAAVPAADVQGHAVDELAHGDLRGSVVLGITRQRRSPPSGATGASVSRCAARVRGGRVRPGRRR